MSRAFHGIFSPLITPIKDDESIDVPSLQRLIAFLLGEGVHGLWVMGTSAEFASFTPEQRAQAVKAAVEAVDGRIPVIANVSDAGTALTIQHAKHAAAAGADAIAATPPYYYPHSQDELLAHYRAIRAAVDLPLYIYNIPQTVRVKVDLVTATSLAAEGTVAGIKDSQNDLEWFRQLVLFVRARDLDFRAFAGTRHLIDAAVLAGADGVIPSISNAYPGLCVEVYEAAAEGKFDRARTAQDKIVAVESLASLVPSGSRNGAVLGLLKASLAERGIIDSAGLTAPLRRPTADEWSVVRERLREMGLWGQAAKA